MIKWIGNSTSKDDSEERTRVSSYKGNLLKLKRSQNLLAAQWGRRWFSIEGRFLKWYRNESDQHQSGMVDLKYTRTISKLQNGSTFVVICQDRNIVLKANSIVEMNGWIRALHIHSDIARGGSGMCVVSDYNQMPLNQQGLGKARKNSNTKSRSSVSLEMELELNLNRLNELEKQITGTTISNGIGMSESMDISASNDQYERKLDDSFDLRSQSTTIMNQNQPNRKLPGTSSNPLAVTESNSKSRYNNDRLDFETEGSPLRQDASRTHVVKEDRERSNVPRSMNHTNNLITTTNTDESKPPSKRLAMIDDDSIGGERNKVHVESTRPPSGAEQHSNQKYHSNNTSNSNSNTTKNRPNSQRILGIPRGQSIDSTISDESAVVDSDFEISINLSDRHDAKQRVSSELDHSGSKEVKITNRKNMNNKAVSPVIFGGREVQDSTVETVTSIDSYDDDNFYVRTPSTSLLKSSTTNTGLGIAGNGKTSNTNQNNSNNNNSNTKSNVKGAW